MRIRESIIEDAYGIAKVHVDSWKNTYQGIVPSDYLESLTYAKQENIWKSILSSKDSNIFGYVVEDDEGQIIGFAGAGPERTGNPEYNGEIYGIYLLPRYQRKGIGTNLVKILSKELLKRNIKSMLVWVLAENPSRSFYKALGGKQLEIKDIEIGGKKFPEISYGWKDISVLVS